MIKINPKRFDRIRVLKDHRLLKAFADPEYYITMSILGSLFFVLLILLYLQINTNGF